MTTEQEKIALAETVINAFGSVYFNPDTVANKLLEGYEAAKEAGQNHDSSLLAAANTIHDIAEQAKKLYEK